MDNATPIYCTRRRARVLVQVIWNQYFRVGPFQDAYPASGKTVFFAYRDKMLLPLLTTRYGISFTGRIISAINYFGNKFWG
jgi:hypothetical protein